jgi:DNA polymerase-3 subunit epsilon
MSLLELLSLERPILFFDCETTGPNPREDRVVQLAFIQIKLDGTTKEWETLINPGMPIPREATFGNGTDDYPGHSITDAMVQGCKTCHDAGHAGVTVDIHDSYPYALVESHAFRKFPSFGDLADNLLIGFSNTDLGGYNIKRYDVPLMAAEFARNGRTWDYSSALLLDGLRIWQLGEGRSLSDAVESFLGRKHQGAHRAIDDVRESLEVVTAQLKRFTQLPRNLKALNEKCWPRDPNAIDPDGKVIWKDGEAVMNFGSKWKGVPLRQMRRQDLQWIVGPKCAGASPAVKQICDDALKGLFPKPLLKEMA